MRHPARLGGIALLSCILVTTFGSVLRAEPAVAAPLPTSLTAAHGLGAKISSSTVATPAVPARAATARVAAVAMLPARVDLTKWAVTPGNQGALSSCVPWTIDYAMLGWYARSTGRVGQPFAPMYTYSQINGGGDYGSDPTAALQLALMQGNDTRAHYTQGDSNWKTQPTAAERVSAAQYKIKGFTTLFVGAARPTNSTLLKQALATNHPVAIELQVRHGFDYLAKGSTAIDIDTTSAIRGSHEVLALGYDAAGIVVQNSWGTGWANGGFGRISWAVVQKDVGEADTIDGFAQAATGPSVNAPSVGRGVLTVKGVTTTYKATWNDTPGNTGAITANNAWLQTDGSSFKAVKLGSARATSFGLAARVGHHYRIAVRVSAGSRVSVVRYSATFVG